MMSILVIRVFAVLGALAHVVGGFVRDALGFIRAGLPWAVIVAALLGLAAWASWDSTRAAEAGLPRPRPVTLGELSRAPGGEWVTLQAVVGGPYWDSSEYSPGVVRHYYVLRDPAETGVAILARSVERLEDRRLRSIAARVVRDEPPLSAADAAPGIRVSDDLFLIERVGEAPAPVLAEARSPGEVAESEAATVTLRAEFTHVGALDCEADPRAAVACAEGALQAYVAVGEGRGVIVASPHAPHALPVELHGVPAIDPLRVEQALAQPSVAEAVAGLQHPESSLLAEGVTPPLADVTYAPAAVLALLAMLLALGWLVGYPIFARHGPIVDAAVPPLTRGAAIAVVLNGWIARRESRVRLDDAPGVIERLAPADFQRRRWQYGQTTESMLEHVERVGDLSDNPAGVLCLSSGHGPAFIDLEQAPAHVSVQPGELYRAASRRPAIRLRADGLEIVASFESAAHRLRALAEIEPGWARAIRTVVPEPMVARRAKPSPNGGGARRITVAAVIFAAVGAFIMAAGIVATLRTLIAADGEAPLGGAALIVLGIGMLLVAAGVRGRRDWARSVGFNVGWIGAAVALVLAWAAQGCGLWMGPNIGTCQAAGIPASILALLAMVALAFAAWTLHRRPEHFDR